MKLKAKLTSSWDQLHLWATKHGRTITLLNVVGQAGIIVTGGAVRLTGSGLGCSTWPQCEPGSFVPQFHEGAGFHAAIEFGNRLVTFVLLIVAVLVALAVRRSRPELKLLGYVPLIGVLIQGVLGGILVLVDLHPLLVAPHLLLSLVLVWFAVVLALRFREAPRAHKAPLRPLQYLHLGLLAALTFLGALTTGAGPHSGDIDATIRLNLDPATISRFHALAVWGYVALLLLIGILLWKLKIRSLGAKNEITKAWLVLVGVTLLQAGIGYLQYFTGLPALIVGFHLAGAAIFVAAHAAFNELTRK